MRWHNSSTIALTSTAFAEGRSTRPVWFVAENLPVSLLLIVLIVVLLFGGGGFYGHRAGYYGNGGIGIIGILGILIILYLLFGSGMR